jgi:ATP-dependent Clp protease protease subunit
MGEPIRVVEGNMKPHQAFWQVRDAEYADGVVEPSIEFYGPISEFSWLGDEVTPAKFKTDLYEAGKGGPVTVRINSGGGEIIAASVIRSMLTEYPGKVTARIDGLCASAATMVAMGADVVQMQDTAYFMIHDPGYSLLAGWLDSAALTELSDHLKLMKSGLVDAYVYRTNLPADEVSRMMKNETWMTAKDAVEKGFADEVIYGGVPAQRTASVENAIKNSVNCPQCLADIPEVMPEVVSQEGTGLGSGGFEGEAMNDDVDVLRDELDLFF